MNPWKLRLSMFRTLAIIIGVSSVFFAVLLECFGPLNLISLVALVAFFNTPKPHKKAEDSTGVENIKG